MKHNQLFIITLLLSIILASSAIAEIEVNTYSTTREFSVSTNYNDIDICACSSKYDSITVTSQASWPAIYTVKVTDTTSIIAVSDNSFELYPGQSKEVFLYVTADCNKGSEEFTIIVESNLGLKKAVDKAIVKDRCQNIEMWIGNYTPSVNPCTPKTFDIVLHNAGPFKDTYTLSSNYDDSMLYSANTLDLEPDQYAQITATTNFACEDYGMKDIVFTARTWNNRLTADAKAPLDIVRSFDYDLEIGDITNSENTDALVCNRIDSTKVPVTITNKGTVSNNYTIKYDLPRMTHIDLENDVVSLDPGESFTFFIDVNSTRYVKQHKTKDAEIAIYPQFGEIVKHSNVNLNFQPCYDDKLTLYDYGNTKSRPLQTCAGYEYSYYFEVKNDGIYTQDYSLVLDNDPSYAKLSDNAITLAPGDKSAAEIKIIGPEDNDLHDVKLWVVSNTGMAESERIWIQAHDTQDCHDTEISSNKYKVDYPNAHKYRVNYQTTNINIAVENEGLVDNAYLVSWEGSDIAKVSNKLLQLNVSDTGAIHMEINPDDNPEGLYNGTLVLKDASGAEYSKLIQIELKDKSLARKAFEYLALNNLCRQVTLAQLVLIPLLIILIIVFMVTSPKYKYNFGNRMKLKLPILIGLGALFLLGLVLILTFTGLPQTQSQVYNLSTNTSNLTYEWLENDNLVIDAGKFFEDPDNSTLKYNVTGLENITAIVSGHMITFYPDNGWSGTEEAVIVASDNQGGSVESPKFTLRVLDVPRKSALELYNIYCWYANLAIYLVILLLVFIAAFVKQEVRRRK